MTEIIGKKKCKIEIQDAKSIAGKFNEFFINIGPNLAKNSAV